ncbi:MAG TPA: BTAD domain-containing putative transcriptional regulator [Streptosporangiaceae bacterium]|nr:BTAD domain-containing putative transcriptional regulator [Streptosporangiaceae bacterium]
MRFRILGPLEVWDDDEQPVTLSRRLHRSTLSLLLLNAGQPCSINSLVAALWPDTPPLSPEVSLRSCIYGIRKLLPDSQRVQTHPSGYLIQVKPGELDLHSFRDLVVSGRDALDSGNALEGATMLAQALELWRDPPVADLPDIHEKDKLIDQRREAQDALIDANLAVGRHRQVLSELRSVVSADPLREHAWAQLMLALYRCGARAEALAAFGRLRMTLVTTYGIEPGPELQELHRQVLADDPALMPRSQFTRPATGSAPGAAELVTATVTPVLTPTVTPAAGLVPARYPVGTSGWPPANGQITHAVIVPAASAPLPAVSPSPALCGPAPVAGTAPLAGPVPVAGTVSVAGAQPAGVPPLARPACQLPAALADFTGRSAELEVLLDRLPGDSMAITILSGMPGAGKTALAVHAAHLAKARFPDGQLCAWLDDCGVARDPQVVLGELLRGLGVPADQIPVSRFEREAMYRSALAERKVLVLVDGASNAAQVRPLLPSTASSAVIVTSRSRLADLDGAKIIELGGMLPADAVTLLAKISGRDLHAANTESAGTAAAGTGWADMASALSISASCGYLPLAVRIAGARLTDDLDLPMASLAELLANENRRLDELSLGDQSVRARLAKATQALSGSARTVLALLAAAGPRDTPGWLIASLLEEPAASMAAPALTNAGLLHRVPGAPNADGGRGTVYRMHPLVRAYAGELLADANPGIVGAATGRLLASGWLELANGGENPMQDHRQPAPTRPS